MSLADAGAPRPPAPTPVYTVYSGGQQGSANYGFRLTHPQEPPPKYEDVVSGEYLKGNLANCGQAPAPIAPTAPLAPPPESESPPQENQKEKCRTAAGALLVALLLTVIFIWRVSIM